jgi:hypothetical protein
MPYYGFKNVSPAELPPEAHIMSGKKPLTKATPILILTKNRIITTSPCQSRLTAERYSG